MCGPEDVNALLSQGKYLAALVAVEKELASATHEQRQFLMQNRGTILSFCGDEAGARHAFSQLDRDRGQKIPTLHPVPKGARREDARKAILREATKRQVVILNEAHHVPRHRAFGRSLLEGLRKQGFTHFAAETFSSIALPKLVAGGAVNRSLGYYTHDPVFASYVREAKHLGFVLVPYETESLTRESDPVAQINNREAEQAKNLQERIFKTNPKAKVFIHVGYAHAIKTPVSFDGEAKLLWMAARLKNALELDPLTIDQTQGTEPCPWELSAVRNPSVYWQTDGKSLASGDNIPCDLSVFHPKFVLRQGRPDWLFTLPAHKPVRIPEALLPKAGRVLMQAFAAGAPDDAIAHDQVIVAAGSPPPVIVVPRGRYQLVAQSEMGEVVSRAELRV